ncbi:beta-phosphoglucomutase family hydrolase [Auraticoccus sp. F435]|uniref:Beta-phosphoglucomutase n=1 Tax=Auraticoccus cholistanensis TaxID=2656650 RepID=A0A6A9V262_9ACTN|nr:beta-phosphoglucomutase family hydrolase [Auraticoccus cholistanensis]MVA77726.1 beta-phosphoglucomutase family hydrolase [Auraticoccus cholistanensis]
MDWSGVEAALFDLDGVLTPTAEVHMRAWSVMFNGFLRGRGVEEPYTDADYFAHVDGKPRYDGVRDFLASRGLTLPEGDPSDDPQRETVCGLGNRKNDAFAQVLAADGVQPYPGSVALLDHLAAATGVRIAVVSSSRNAVPVLEAAGLRTRFDVVVDGVVAARDQLPGKPRPDTFVRAAELLGAQVAASVVLEDALSGVAAGRAGGFGHVVGVDRGVGAEALTRAGADVVVRDLAELVPG